MYIYWFFVFIFISNNSNASKLNYPRVLLPIFEKNPINFTVEVVEKGCFKWYDEYITSNS